MSSVHAARQALQRHDAEKCRRNIIEADMDGENQWVGFCGREPGHNGHCRVVPSPVTADHLRDALSALDAAEKRAAKSAERENMLRAVVEVFWNSSHTWVGPRPTDAVKLAAALGLRTATTLGQLDDAVRRLVTVLK